MSKGSGGTRATNSRTAHGDSSNSRGGIESKVAKFNAIKLDSAEAFDVRQNAMVSILDNASKGTQINLSDNGREIASYVKNSSGKFVQRHLADSGQLEDAHEQWSDRQIANKFMHLNMTIKKYK